MKNFKKIISVILVILTLSAMFVMPSVAANEDEVVARMYVFSAVTSKAPTGHSWIYVENLTNETITVGLYQLPAGEGVSVGTGKKRRADGAGVYYNIESYLVNNKASGANRRSMKMDITAAQLQKVSDTINANNRWSIIFNCSNFAEKVWNSVASGSKKVYSLGTPSFLKTWIGLKPHSKNVPMMNVTPEQCFRQKGDTLVVVSSGSLTKAF